MKKFFCFAFIFMLLAPQTIFAAPNGSVTEQYYYTDIKTYFFGAPITAYNLGGKTAIVCEDLNWHYGHSVYWYADERKLTVDKNSNVQFASLQALAGETLREQNGISGEIAGDVYSTDIKTYLNGKLIESYNIGGQTVIICEDMREYGYDVEWNEEKRTLSVTGNNSNFQMESDIGTVMQTFDGYGMSGGDASFTYQLKVDGQPVALASPMMRTLYGIWVPLAPTLDALGAQYEWDAESKQFTVTSFDPSKIKTAEPLQSDFVGYLDKPRPTIALRLYDKDKEIPMTTTVWVGHMQNAHEQTVTLNAVLYDGVVYVPFTAITDCLGLEVAVDDNENIMIAK